MQKQKRFLFLFLIAGLCVSGLTAHTQQTSEKFIRETDYLLSLPDGYDKDSTRHWPLVIFLHGSGESGTDLEKVKAHGPPKLVAAGKKFPFILVSPQAQHPFDWEPDNLYHLLVYIKHKYRVEESRVYLTGLSMGGFGTWAFAIKYPGEFAAIIPICGGGDTTDIWKLRHTSLWCFHGALDQVVPVARDEQMVNAARQYNPSAKFTIYPDADHNSWERTYNNDSVYEWMLAQTKFTYKEMPVDPVRLKEYAGKYIGQQGDTVVISTDKDGLHAATSHQAFLLRSFGKDVFFIDEHMPVDVKFIRTPKGKCNSFWVLEQTKNYYRRI
jgi:dienelactone hydrolase